MNKQLQSQMEETVFDIDIHSRENKGERVPRLHVGGIAMNKVNTASSTNSSSPDTLLSRLKVRFEICPAYMACGRCFLDYSECPYFNKVKFNTRHRECDRFFQEVNHRQSQVFITRIASEYGGKDGE